MALNFTVSYTFSPGTTISSSQVNTNTSDVASVFTGLEAETKTLAKLKMDSDPTLALEVATKQYVDHYSTYRRPVLQYSSATVVNMETGVNGVSGQAQILFPDGTIRTDSTAGRINCNLAQVAALSGAWQSGLRTGTVAANTWYAVYACKTTDDTSKFVAVADTVLPLQANFATLNSNFGTSGWVYLGMVRNGDGDASASGIIQFVQAGSTTLFINATAGGNSVMVCPGIKFATTASATSLAYTYAAGTSGAVIPNHLTSQDWSASINATGGATVLTFRESNTGSRFYQTDVAINHKLIVRVSYSLIAGNGLEALNGAASPEDIYMVGFVDGVLGVGPNPIL